MILARPARVHEFQFDVISHSLEIPIPPLFPRISRGRAAAFFHRTIVSAARRVRIHFVRRPPNDVNASPVRLPTRNARSVVLVRVRDTPVVLFLKIVIRQIRIAAAPQPELFDKLFALFVRIELQKRRPLVRRNNVDHVLVHPFLVLLVELFQSATHLLLLLFSQLLRTGRGRRVARRRLRLLRRHRWQRNRNGKNPGDERANYPGHDRRHLYF